MAMSNNVYLEGCNSKRADQVRQQPAGINFSNEIDLILKRRLVSQVKLLSRVREEMCLHFSCVILGK